MGYRGQGIDSSKRRKYVVLFTVVILILLSYLVAATSAGMSFRIVTDKPVEDIVVRCVKSKDYLVGHNASSYAVIYNTLVVSSNARYSCGFTIGGKPSRLEVYHPSYVFHEEKTSDKGERIISMIPATDKLQLLERKYLDHYWNTHADPLAGFIYHVDYSCPFSGLMAENYIKYRGQDKRPDYRAFKQKYYEDVKLCMERQEALRRKYDRSPARAFVDNSLYPCTSLKRGSCDESKAYRPDLMIGKMLNYSWGEKLWGASFSR